MSKNFFPRSDCNVQSWTLNFRNRITEFREQYYLTQDQVDRYAALQEEFAVRLTATSNPSTRNKVEVIAKNEALRELEIYSRELAARVRADSRVSSQLRILLGIGVRKARSRSHEPIVAPEVFVKKVVGQAVTIVLIDNSNGSAQIPRGAKGASVSICISEEEPRHDSKWIFVGNTTRAVAKFAYPETLPIGTRVWIVASWYGPRGQPGPESAAVSTVLLGQSRARPGRILRAA